MGQPLVSLFRPKVQLDQPKVLWVCAPKGRILEQMLLLEPRFRPEMSKKEFIKFYMQKIPRAKYKVAKKVPIKELVGGIGDAHSANFDEKVHKPQSKSYGRIGASWQLIFTDIL